MTTYYVDSVAGADGNAGTSIGAPKETLYSAYTAAAAGSTILLAQGLYHPGGTSGPSSNSRCFVSSSGYIQDAAHAGITIGSYDAGYGYDRPVLDGMAWSQPGEAGWTHVGSGVWKFTPSGATSYARRLWLGSLLGGLYVGDRQLGTAAHRCDDAVAGEPPTFHATEAAVIAALSASAPWYSTSNNGDFAATPWLIYVFTGSEIIDPPTYYGGLAWVQTGVSANGLVIRNSANDVTLRDIVIRGCSSSYGVGIGNLSLGSVSGLLVSNVGIESYGLGGLVIYGVGASGYTVTGVEIRDVTVDAKSSTGEIETGDNEFYEGIDDVEIGYCSGLDIDGLTITAHASSHSALSIGGSGLASAAYPVESCRVRNANITMYPDCTDARAFVFAYCNNTRFGASIIHGGNVRCQIGGKNTTINGVVHDDLSTASAQFTGSDMIGQWAVIGQSGYSIENMTISNCVLDARNGAAVGSAFGIVRNTAGVYGPAAGEVVFANNVAILAATQSMFGVGVDNNTGPTFDTAREQTYTTNAAMSSDTGRAVELCGYNTAQTAVLGYYTYATVSDGITIAASDVGLTEVHMPTDTSVLIEAGTHLGYAADARRSQRWNPPSIGAYEYQRARTARDLPT